jgi:hypothetical protein
VELVTWTSRSLGAFQTVAAGQPWRNTAHHPHPLDRTPVGYDYVHSLIDNQSRLAYSEILPDEKGPTCVRFLRRAATYFAVHGIAQIERVMTDNAWAHATACERPSPLWVLSRCSFGHTAPG